MASLALDSLPHPPHANVDGNGRIALALCFALATVAHAAFGFGVKTVRRPIQAPPPMIVELAPPPAIEPPKAPEPPKEMAPESSAKNVAPAPRLAAHAPPVQSPAAARAGALLTAKEDISKPSDAPPVDFVTDPSGTTYGGGVVARGGTADFGVRGATAAGVGHTPVSPSAAPSDGVTAPANLSRAPRLTEPDACRGYYPSEANVDEGGATVAVIVKANGDVSQATVLSETPVGQGFGHAARTCLSQKRFAPAQDRQGAAVIARTSVRVRFSR